MSTFNPMTCRVCGQVITPQKSAASRRVTTEAYKDSCYKCPNPWCQVAYSNRCEETARTLIHPKAELNVPEEVRGSLAMILDSSLNIKNQTHKREVFAFETSEDAVTWTTFQYIQEWQSVASVLSIEQARLSDLLFWGTPWPIRDCCELRERFVEVALHQFQEGERYLTEPDVIADWRELLCFINVKYRSDHHVERTKPFAKYVQGNEALFAASLDRIAERGYYELTRNWVLGSVLAQRMGKAFLLINLASEGSAASAEAFSRLLATDDKRQFRFLSWRQLFARLPRPLAPWFEAYATSRGLPDL